VQRLDLLFTVSIEDFRTADDGKIALSTAICRALDNVGINLLVYINDDQDLIVLSRNGFARWRADVPQSCRDFIAAYNSDLRLTDKNHGFVGFYAIDGDDRPCVAMVGFTEKIRFTSY
jgi:hypothetical protein